VSVLDGVAKTNQGGVGVKEYIVKLEEGCWLAPWSGDPGRTCVEKNAMRYRMSDKAARALKRARMFSPFADASIIEIDETEISNKNILLQAVEHYGAKNQAGQLMGEMGELAAAVTQHFFQGRDRAKEIAEEIADVQIMLEQMILHLDIEEEVARWRSSKLKRLESRMNQAG
jgi:NTP pyrophosphatase (non-canonical NTP hydrolase)